MTLEEEKQLIEKARAGDGEAFGRIYDAFKTPIFRTVIFPRVREVSAAEEILQDTFLLALEKLDVFEWQERSIFFWIRMIAINKVREWISGTTRTATVDSAVLDYQPDNAYQPENQVILEDQESELHKKTAIILEEINDRYSGAIRLRLLEKKSREDCAAALEISVETFDVVFFRACKAFRKAYIDKYGEL
ncbi:MAG: sigma-70 family RNA polymerase sigma factor [bacterium]